MAKRSSKSPYESVTPTGTSANTTSSALHAALQHHKGAGGHGCCVWRSCTQISKPTALMPCAELAVFHHRQPTCFHAPPRQPSSAVLWRWGVLVVPSLHHHEGLKTSSRSCPAVRAKIPTLAKPCLTQLSCCPVTKRSVQYVCPPQLAPFKDPRYRCNTALSLKVLGCVKNRCQLGWLRGAFWCGKGHFQHDDTGAHPVRV